MFSKNRRYVNMLYMLADAALLFAAYFASVDIRYYVLDGMLSVPVKSGPFVLLALGCSVLTVLVCCALQLYSARTRSLLAEALLLAAVNGVTTLVLMAVFFVLRVTEFSRGALVIFWVLSSLLLFARRALVRLIAAQLRRRGYGQKHVILVGSGHLAQQYAQDVRTNAQLGVVLDGYISDTECEVLGERLGGFARLGEVLERYDPDDLVAALDPQDIGVMPQVLAAADREGTHLSMIPFYNDYFPVHPTIETVGRSKLINLRATPLDDLLLGAVKRLMDIAGSLVLILLTSPVMLVVAAGVKLSSPGPILFKQERVGKNKKPFRMWKFRSMRVTGTESTGWSTNNDPRKTPFGSFIRKYSLDELPQFFNVLAGQMSLVGPRPEVPFHVSHFKEEVPLYLVRQQVRPGITGWAQVNGLRGDTSIEERVKYDIWYIENWSLALDIRILFMTVFGGMKNDETLQTKKDGGEKTDG